MSNLKAEARVYRLSGLTPIMGSLPASQSLRTEYIASKAPTAELAAEEAASDFEGERGLTVFARDKLGQLCLMGYQVKGFFKSALYALRGQSKIPAYKSRVDLLLFVEPRFIPITRDGKPVPYYDDILERPLRRSGIGGESVALAASELIEDPWSADLEITLLPDSKGEKAKGELLTWDILETALDYGAYHGLGQWRNADYGRFTWSRID